jgi:catechol 2,3-dioxygenase-like lactoylglutathione lyase family enzyme
MEQIIDTMLRAFETGKMTRRELVRTLVALPAASQLATLPSHTPFKGVSINHVTFSVSDLKKKTEFYQNLLGMRFMQQRGSSNYLALGSSQSFLCLTQAAQGTPTSINHFCIGIENFDADKVMDTLKQEKLETRTDATGQVYFLDPDGLRVQLSSTKYNGEGRG